MFPGILPTTGKVSVPLGFSMPREPSPHSEQSEEIDAESALAAALLEWQTISDAFDAFKVNLGEHFQPLPDGYTDRRESPFGPPLQYRTFAMAGIWMNFYMGCIHLHRTHPSMPPVAMMAAGHAAQRTAVYAREIGRIAAGLSGDCREVTKIGTLKAAAFIESSFCLFVAAIQVCVHAPCLNCFDARF